MMAQDQEDVAEVEEVATPHEIAQDVVQDMQADQQEAVSAPEPVHEEERVPLTKYIKERRRRQELEQEIALARQQRQPVEDDSARYETVSKHDLSMTQNEIIRVVEERQWIKNNPEKHDRLTAELEDFLRQRPHLAEAIKHAPNRWEEAYTLMEALSPRQQAMMKKEPNRKQAPHAPTSVPKSAAINQAVDVMNMTDAEFNAWRASKKRRR
jgi:hypothetical protein